MNKPGLFGGTKREGGIAGDIDVMRGGPGQQPNDYLAAQAGESVPAYRGVTSLVLRQAYLGNNPYLKPWSVLLTRILKAARGNGQWYPETAQIVPEAAISDAAIYIALGRRLMARVTPKPKAAYFCAALWPDFHSAVDIETWCHSRRVGQRLPSAPGNRPDPQDKADPVQGLRDTGECGL